MAKLNHTLQQGKINRITDQRDYNGCVFVELSIGREKSERFDNPIIIVDKPEMVKDVLDANDRILKGEELYINVRGQIETYKIPLQIKCVNSKCELPFERQVNKMYIRAKKVKVFKSDVPVFINSVHLLGSLVTDVYCKETGSQTQRSTYRLGVNAYKNKAYYPSIVSFHEQAVSDKLRMHIKSQCVVYGFFQTRPVNIGCVCPVCDTKQPRMITTAEIMAVNVEYLNNCNFDEEEVVHEEEFLSKALLESHEIDFPKDHPINRKKSSLVTPLTQIEKTIKN